MLFTGVSIFAGAEAAAQVAALQGLADLQGEFVRASYIGIGLAIPSLFHLAVVFPRNVSRGRVANAVSAVYTIGLIFAALSPTRLLVASPGELVGSQDAVFGPLYWPLQGFLIGAVVVSLGWQAYLTARGRPAERRPAAALVLIIAAPLGLGGAASLMGHGTIGPFDSITLSFTVTVVVLAFTILTGRLSPPSHTAFRALVDSIDEAVVIVDGRGRPASMNARAREVLGLGEAREAWGGVSQLFTEAGLGPEKAELLNRTVMAVLRGRMDTFGGNFEGVGPGKRTCSVRVLPFGRRDTEDEAEAALIMLRDETDRLGLEAATTKSRDILDLVIRMLGHDLKAPLTVIQGYIDLDRVRLGGADAGAQVPAVRGDLEKMWQAIVGMQLVMGNARSLSRLAAVGDDGPSLVDLDFTRMVRQTIDLLRPLAQTKQITVEATVAEGVLTRTAPGFDSVPRNLLDNAIKYSPPGGRITVALSAEGDRARLTVSDTGEGIPPEKVDRLFRKFERLGAEKGAQEGHGLGLSIVAKLVELSAGTVHVEDRTDGRPGAVFRVEVPLAQAPM